MYVKAKKKQIIFKLQFFSDFENEDYVYAVVCGVFLSSTDDRKKVIDKMKEVVPYTNCTYVNLTESHNLEKVAGKDSYAFCLEYDYSSDTAKGKSKMSGLSLKLLGFNKQIWFT